MARPGVGPRRDETPAVGVSGSGFGTGLASDAASSPDPEAVFVVCHELLGRLHRRAPRQTLLYVDVNGVALLDAKTARCVSRAGFNELTSWCAVDARVFELKQLGVETRKLELRRFETTSAVAAELAAAMRSRVRLYVERPDEVRRLRATAATFRAGDTVRRETLARAHALGGGEAAAAASRFAKQTPFAKKKVPGSADESRARRLLRAATPGERLARAGARRAARFFARDQSQPSEVPPPDGDDAAETASLSLSGDESESSGERFTTGSGFFQFGDANGNNSFADGAGLDDASLRAAYARREAAYFKLREEEDAAWAASREEREERETESDGERGIARETFSFAAKSPTEPPSDARSARGFHKRERARELERERARAAETIASPPPALFDATLANPRMEPEPAEDPEAWLGGADYFYDDFSDEGEDDDDGKGAEKERRPSSGLSGYDPVSVSPRSPGASARTPSNTRGGGRTDQTAIDEETARLNRRVRGFAGLLRDSLSCVSRARNDADVRAECAVLVDRLRRFTAEGVAEEEGFAG